MWPFVPSCLDGSLPTRHLAVLQFLTHASEVATCQPLHLLIPAYNILPPDVCTVLPLLLQVCTQVTLVRPSPTTLLRGWDFGLFVHHPIPHV